MKPKDITEHIGGLLCACYECRTRKGSRVRESIEVWPKVRMYDPSEPIQRVELKHREYELQELRNYETLEYKYEYIPLR
jgi:hypothetical protein